MRLVSMQPSISIILEQLDRLDLLVACTKYCVQAVPALAELPIQVIHDSWSANTEEILAATPNLVLAAVPYRIDSLAAILKAGVAVLTLAPHTLDDILSDIRLLGRITNQGEVASTIITDMQAQLETIRLRASHSRAKPLVYCEEWGKPLIHSQPWVDELIQIAGGRTFGTAGVATDEQTIRDADPDIMIFAWCGAGDRVPLERLVRSRGWLNTRAVAQSRVYCIPDEWLNTPAPTLLKGAWSIAAALQPEIFVEQPTPRQLRWS